MDINQFIAQEGIPRLSLPDIDMRDTLSFQNSLSSGVNKLPPPRLYRELFGDKIFDQHMIHNYTLTTGTPVLAESIKIYENINAKTDTKTDTKADTNKDTAIFEHICITSGATAAIVYFFRYFHLKYPSQSVLMLGLNYYLFYECIARNHISYKNLCSRMQNRISPTIDEIIEEIKIHSYKLVVLTMPFNPSGEIYSPDELRKLVRFFKQKEIMLLYDKCQMDEFADNFTNVNANAIVYEEQYANDFILINSVSKTRSLAGARIGYICANKEIIHFINHENEYYCFNHPQILIAPMVLDQLCKSIKAILCNKSPISIKKIIKTFRNTIVLSSGYEYYDMFFKNLFQEETMMRVYEDLQHDILSNYKIIYDNYHHLKQQLWRWIDQITTLQGGFNFCIKLKDTASSNQLMFCSRLSKHIKAVVIPESFYNGAYIHDSDHPFWIRITCAQHTDIFTSYVNSFKDFLTNPLR